MTPIVTRVVHLERTSEADAVPAQWAVAEINRKLLAIPEVSRASAMLTGWRGAAIEYQHKRTELEVAQDRLALVVGVLRGKTDGMSGDEIKALLEAL